VGLGRAVGAQGHAQGRDHTPQCRGERGADRSGGAEAARRSRAGGRAARAADARGARRPAEGRDREMGGDHQGGQHQAGIDVGVGVLLPGASGRRPPLAPRLSNSSIVAAFNLPLAVLAAWLLWRSLDWPLVGDAAIFHFIAGQMTMGAVPYRDIVDVNMPLTYVLHLALVTAGGMSDATWRAFDLAAAATLSALILMLVAPAGCADAILYRHIGL